MIRATSQARTRRVAAALLVAIVPALLLTAGQESAGAAPPRGAPVDRILLLGKAPGSPSTSGQRPPTNLFAVGTDRPGYREWVSRVPAQPGMEWRRPLLSRDGSRVAAVQDEGRSLVVRRRDGRVVLRAALPPALVGAGLAAWSPEGRSFVLSSRSESSGTQLHLWRPGPANRRATLVAVSDSGASAAFHPTRAGTVYVSTSRGAFQWRSGRLTTVIGKGDLPATFSYPGALAVAADGRHLAIAAGDGIATMGTDGRRLRLLPSQVSTSYGDHLAFSHDGTALFASMSTWADGEWSTGVVRIALDGSARTTTILPPDRTEIEAMVVVPARARDPLAPAGLTATSTREGISLRWPPLRPGLRPRLVRIGTGPARRGRPVPVARGGRAATDRLPPGTAATYLLSAVDRQGRSHGPVSARVVALVPPTLRGPLLPTAATADPAAGRSIIWGSSRNPRDTWYTSWPLHVAGHDRSTTSGYGGTVVATAYDRFGNATPRSTRSFAAAADQVASLFTGRWVSVEDDQAWLGTTSATTEAGATLTFRSTFKVTRRGDRLRLFVIGEKGPGHGELAIELDGEQVAVVDTLADHTTPRTVLWSTTLAPGAAAPTVSVAAMGTPGRPLVVLDAVAGTGQPSVLALEGSTSR